MCWKKYQNGIYNNPIRLLQIELSLNNYQTLFTILQNTWVWSFFVMFNKSGLALVVMFNKFMNLIRTLNRDIFYFSN